MAHRESHLTVNPQGSGWRSTAYNAPTPVPGAILTERQQALWRTPEVDRRILDDQALKFHLDASHVARMALLLASDESVGCTGADFLMDAGLTLN